MNTANRDSSGDPKGGESAKSSRRPFLYVLLVALGIFGVVAILAAIANDMGPSRNQMPGLPPIFEVHTAIAWLQTWLGFIFVVMSPLVGLALFRRGTLAWTVIPACGLFLAGAALLGLGSWGPFVGLGAVAVATGAMAFADRKV